MINYISVKSRHGVLAQLVARDIRIVEARGSTPLYSTTKSQPETVGFFVIQNAIAASQSACALFCFYELLFAEIITYFVIVGRSTLIILSLFKKYLYFFLISLDNSGIIVPGGNPILSLR